VTDLGRLSGLFRDLFCCGPGYQVGVKQKPIIHAVRWELPGPEIPMELRRQPEIPDAVEFARTRFGFEPD
jgi:hypothetical protein